MFGPAQRSRYHLDNQCNARFATSSTKVQSSNLCGPGLTSMYSTRFLEAPRHAVSCHGITRILTTHLHFNAQDKWRSFWAGCLLDFTHHGLTDKHSTADLDVG